MFSTVLSILLAFARAVPAIEQLLRAVVRERDLERQREAANRLEQKNAAVDRAIDAPAAASGSEKFEDQGEPGPGI